MYRGSEVTVGVVIQVDLRTPGFEICASTFSLCVCVCACVCVHVCVHVSMYMCMFICIFVRTYVSV